MSFSSPIELSIREGQVNASGGVWKDSNEMGAAIGMATPGQH
jgi:hypothetical protein